MYTVSVYTGGEREGEGGRAPVGGGGRGGDDHPPPRYALIHSNISHIFHPTPIQTHSSNPHPHIFWKPPPSI